MTDVTAVYSPAKEKVQTGAVQSRQSGWQLIKPIISLISFLLILTLISWVIIDLVSEPRTVKEPPCRTKWGVPKNQEWCDALK